MDAGGVESADAVLAVLDGPSVDDGTACEIGLFYGLKQRDPERKGVVGLLTDLRGERRGDFAVNLFVRGCIDASGGAVVGSLDEALAILAALALELARQPAAQSDAFTAGDPGRRRTGLAATRQSSRAGRGSMHSNRTTPCMKNA